MRPTKFSHKDPPREKGQGFVEYAIILLLVGVSAFLIITLMGPSFAGVFSRIVRQAPVAPPSLANWTPPPTSTIDPASMTGTPTSTPPGGGGGPGNTPTATHTPTLTPTPTETSTPAPTLTPSPTATPLPPATNLCLDPSASVSQSSTAFSGNAQRACDGNTDGNYNNNSVTHTNNETTPYWEVDLGSVYNLQQIKLFNRTDCCLDRLANFYVFISDNPFTSPDLNTTRNQGGVDEYFFDGDVDSLAFALTNTTGRYVRIQLSGTNYLSLAEVEIIGSKIVPNKCEALADMFYIFDVSGSMDWAFPGANSKIEAAKDAVTTVNNSIDAANTNSRVGFVTFTSGNWVNNNGWRLPHVLSTIPLTTDIPAVNGAVAGWNASGGTPTGGAINEARLTMIDTWDPLRIPVVVLVSDGVPTVDLQERGYPDSNVQQVVVYDGNGVAYTPNFVENSGPTINSQYYSPEPAGYVVAETMREVLELKRSLPDVTVHSIAIGGSGFNTEVLQYVAEAGGGQSFAANNAQQLADQMLGIFNSISCDPNS